MSEEIGVRAWRGLVVDIDDDTEVYLETREGKPLTLKIPKEAAYELVTGLISALSAVHRSQAGSQVLTGVQKWRIETQQAAPSSTMLHVETTSGTVASYGVAPAQLETLAQLLQTRLSELRSQSPEPAPPSRSLN